MTISEWIRRRRAVRDLKQAAHGLTLNSIGPLYGCHRAKGESNKEYERRIMKAVMTIDKVWTFTEGSGQAEVKEEEQ